MQGLQAAVHVHGLADLALLASLGSPGRRACAALTFSPDGRRLAAAEAAPGRHITVYSWREACALAGLSPLTAPAHVLCPHGKVHVIASWELQHNMAVWLRDIMHALPPCTHLWLLSARCVCDVICCESPSDQSKLGTSITGYSSAPGAQKSRVGSTGWPKRQCHFLFHRSPPYKVLHAGRGGGRGAGALARRTAELLPAERQAPSGERLGRARALAPAHAAGRARALRLRGGHARWRSAGHHLRWGPHEGSCLSGASRLAAP